MKYTVTLRGCHEDTSVTVDLMPEQAAVVADVAEVVAANAFGCQPSMDIDQTPGMVVDADTPAAAEVEA